MSLIVMVVNKVICSLKKINFAKILSKNSLVVMGPTGYYHYRFAQFLYKKGVVVSIVNS
jgi:transposase